MLQNLGQTDALSLKDDTASHVLEFEALRATVASVLYIVNGIIYSWLCGWPLFNKPPVPWEYPAHLVAEDSLLESFVGSWGPALGS